MFAFLLGELKTVRLICQREGCGAVTEVTPDKLESVGHRGNCPVCGQDLYPATPFQNANPIVKLALALQAVQAAQKPGAVQVELVMPDPGE